MSTELVCSECDARYRVASLPENAKARRCRKCGGRLSQVRPSPRATRVAPRAATKRKIPKWVFWAGGATVAVFVVTVVAVVTFSFLRGRGAVALPEVLDPSGYGKPVRLSEPKLYRSQRNTAVLVVQVETDEPIGGDLIFRMHSNSNGGHFEAQQPIAGPLKDGPLSIPVMSWNFGALARNPVCEAYLERNGERVSNTLTVRLPSDAESLPLDPSVVSLQQRARPFHVRLGRQRFVGTFGKDSEIEFEPVGEPVAGLKYALRLNVGPLGKTTPINTEELRKPGRLKIPHGLPYKLKDLTFLKGDQLKVSVVAFDPSDELNTVPVSNTFTLEAPPGTP